jgi:hypothetical protein
VTPLKFAERVVPVEDYITQKEIDRSTLFDFASTITYDTVNRFPQISGTYRSRNGTDTADQAIQSGSMTALEDSTKSSSGYVRWNVADTLVYKELSTPQTWGRFRITQAQAGVTSSGAGMSSLFEIIAKRANGTVDTLPIKAYNVISGVDNVTIDAGILADSRVNWPTAGLVREIELDTENTVEYVAYGFRIINLGAHSYSGWAEFEAYDTIDGSSLIKPESSINKLQAWQGDIAQLNNGNPDLVTEINAKAEASDVGTVANLTNGSPDIVTEVNLKADQTQVDTIANTALTETEAGNRETLFRFNPANIGFTTDQFQASYGINATPFYLDDAAGDYSAYATDGENLRDGNFTTSARSGMDLWWGFLTDFSYIRKFQIAYSAYSVNNEFKIMGLTVQGGEDTPANWTVRPMILNSLLTEYALYAI